jgi:hypothetical protein
MNDRGSEDNPVGFKGIVEFHSGSSTPSPYIETKKGVGATPAWPHLTYVVLRSAAGAGAWLGTSEVMQHMKFVCERMPTAASTGMGEPADAGSYWAVDTDSNPAYAIAEILTDEDYGAGLPPARIDAASVHAAAKVLYDEGHGTSQLWDSQRTCGAVLFEICRQIGGILQPDPVTGLLKLRLLRATETALFDFNESNIEKLSQLSGTAMDEVANTLTVTYTARDEKWVSRPAPDAQDLAAIEVAGQVIPSSVSYPGVTNAALAATLAVRDLRATSAPLQVARFTAIVPQGQVFVPGDPITFSWAKAGITSLRMRVTKARYSTPGQASCEIDAIEDVFMAGEAVYGTVAPVTGTGGGSGGSGTVAGVVNGSFYGGGALQIITAPYGITGDDADHGLAFALAPDAITTGYDLQWCSAISGSYGSELPVNPQYHDRTLGFAAIGTLSAAMGDIANPGSITINISAANAAVLRRFGSKEVPLFVDKEHIFASAVSVNTGGTQAALTLSMRGCWDSEPLTHASGASVIVLCDYAIDPFRLATTVTNDSGNVVLNLSGQADLYARAQGRNSVGVAAWGTMAGASYMDGWRATGTPPGHVRAPLPYCPGKIKLGGIYGSTTQAGAPTISGSTAYLTWALRNRLAKSASAWDTGDGISESSSFLSSYSIDRWNGTAWVNIASGGINNNGSTTGLLSLSGIAAGQSIRAHVGSSGIVPGGPTGYWASLNGATWYWTKG